MRASATLSIAMLGFSTASSAITPESSRAVILAVQSGEIIGAAAVCGLPQSEAAEIGRGVIGQIRQLATTEAELARAQARHEQAVARGASKARQAGESACPASIERARGLIRER